MKTFYVKAYRNEYGSTIHFARLIATDTIEHAEIMFYEEYGWKNIIDIIEEQKKL